MNRSASQLSYEQISEYFSCPIHQACIYLKVERNELKKRCLELKIKKWPYRQFQRKKVAPPEGMFGCFNLESIEPINNELQGIIRRCSDDSTSPMEKDQQILEKISISNLLI